MDAAPQRVTLLGVRETRELLARHGLRPLTGLGQHFVVDPNTVRKVVRLAEVEPGDPVLEIGAGVGALTLALVEAGARVTAIERDRRLEPVLREAVGGTGVRVVWGDAMELDDVGDATKMVSNLPYQVATPLVLRLLAEQPGLRSHTFMVQREVGERFAATPGGAAYGAVSVKVAWFARAEVAGRISRRAFWPVPDVESVVVRLVRHDAPPVPGDRKRLFHLIETGFAQRRKTLRNALRAGGWDADAIATALGRAGIDAGARAQELGLDRFAALAETLPERP